MMILCLLVLQLMLIMIKSNKLVLNCCLFWQQLLIIWLVYRLPVWKTVYPSDKLIVWHYLLIIIVEIALTSPSQSSVYGNLRADLAVDGNTNGQFGGGSCMHTGRSHTNGICIWVSSYILHGVQALVHELKNFILKTVLNMGDKESECERALTKNECMWWFAAYSHTYIGSGFCLPVTRWPVFDNSRPILDNHLMTTLFANFVEISKSQETRWICQTFKFVKNQWCA